MIKLYHIDGEDVSPFFSYESFICFPHLSLKTASISFTDPEDVKFDSFYFNPFNRNLRNLTKRFYGGGKERMRLRFRLPC